MANSASGRFASVSQTAHSRVEPPFVLSDLPNMHTQVSSCLLYANSGRMSVTPGRCEPDCRRAAHARPMSAHLALAETPDEFVLWSHPLTQFQRRSALRRRKREPC